MKKIAIFLALFFSLTLPALAGNTINNIGIQVDLQEDGSGLVTQTWVTDASEGTEFYIIQDNLNGMDVLALNVADDRGVNYENIGSWNVDSSFKDKANKCGVVKTDTGYELCWGISEYGKRTYTISYYMPNMVQGYTDLDGFNLRFINDKMTSKIKDALVEIRYLGVPLTADNAGIWGFGFEGEVFFGQGSAFARNTDTLGSRNHMTVMMSFNKGLFNPLITKTTTFEEVKETAFKGSDYDRDQEPPLLLKIFLCVFVAGVLVLLLWLTIKSIKASRDLKKLEKEADYFRDLPQKGNIYASNFFANTYGLISEKNNVISALFLQFIYDGNLEMVSAEESGFMGIGTKTHNALRLVTPPKTTANSIARDLYSYLEEASRDDGILQEKELEKWCKTNYEKYMALSDRALGQGVSDVAATNCFKLSSTDTPRVFDTFKTHKLGPVGVRELSNLLGFKKYLLEFSLISERGAYEVSLWNGYLVFASLLGIADQVGKDFEKLYPEYFSPEMTTYSPTQALFLASSLQRSAYRSAAATYNAKRASGAGGGSSFGGGGGFSGGGSGGGSR